MLRDYETEIATIVADINLQQSLLKADRENYIVPENKG